MSFLPLPGCTQPSAASKGKTAGVTSTPVATSKSASNKVSFLIPSKEKKRKLTVVIID